MRVLFAFILLVGTTAHWVYYKIDSGPAYGPFMQEQLLQWERDGHFRGHDLKVSTSTVPGSFTPFHAYLRDSRVGNTVVAKSSKSSISALSGMLKKKLSTAAKLGKKIRSLSVSGSKARVPEHSDTTRDIARDVLNSPKETNDAETQRPDDAGEDDGSEPLNAHAQTGTSVASVNVANAALPEQQVEALHRNHASEEELLKQLKRDAPVLSQESTGTWRSTDGPEKQAQRPEKYSVKSMAKDGMSLWAEEESGRSHSSVIGMKPALGGFRKANLFTPKTHSLGRMSGQIARMSSWIVPTSLRRSTSYLWLLVQSQEGRTALLYLVADLALKLLRLQLFLLLLVNIVGIATQIPTSGRMSGIVNIAPESISRGGGISTSVLSDTPGPVPLAASDILRVDFLQLIQTYTRQALHALRHADMQVVLESVARAQQQVMQRGTAVLRELSRAEKQTMHTALILAALLALSGVILPAVAWGVQAQDAAFPSAVSAGTKDGSPAGKTGTTRPLASTCVKHIEACAAFMASTALVGLAVLALCTTCRVQRSAEKILGCTLLAPLSVSFVGVVIEMYGSPIAARMDTQNTRASEHSIEAIELRARRCTSLSDMLSAAREVDACRRAGLLEYASDLLRGEIRALTQKATQLQESTSRCVSHPPALRFLRRVLLGLAVIMASVWGWSAISQSAQTDAADLLSAWFRLLTALQDAVPEMFFKHPQKVLSALMDRLSELLPHTERVIPPLRVGRSAAAGLQAWLLPLTVLVLPSLYYHLQLGAIDRMERYDALLQPGASTEDAGTAHAVDAIRRVVQLAERVLRTVSQAGPENAPLPPENVAQGIEINQPELEVGGGRVPSKLSMRIAPGKITVIACASSSELQTADALLGSLAGAATEAGAVVKGMGDLLVEEGRGRGGELGNGARITCFSGRELQLPLQAGAVAGYVPGTAGSGLRRVLRAQVAAGAHSIIATLPDGPATFLRATQHDLVDVGEVELTEDQWRTLHLSRALSQCDRDVLLLAQPTRGMSGAQERLFFQFLRESLRPDQVVVLTSDRPSTAACADEVKYISSGDEEVGAEDAADASASLTSGDDPEY